MVDLTYCSIQWFTDKANRQKSKDPGENNIGLKTPPYNAKDSGCGAKE